MGSRLPRRRAALTACTPIGSRTAASGGRLFCRANSPTGWPQIRVSPPAVTRSSAPHRAGTQRWLWPPSTPIALATPDRCPVSYTHPARTTTARSWPACSSSAGLTATVCGERRNWAGGSGTTRTCTPRCSRKTTPASGFTPQNPEPAILRPCWATPIRRQDQTWSSTSSTAPSAGTMATSTSRSVVTTAGARGRASWAPCPATSLLPSVSVSLRVYPQVVSRNFPSFRIINSAVIPGQAVLCAWFDSRQLHNCICRSDDVFTLRITPRGHILGTPGHEAVHLVGHVAEVGARSDIPEVSAARPRDCGECPQRIVCRWQRCWAFRHSSCWPFWVELRLHDLGGADDSVGAGPR